MVCPTVACGHHRLRAIIKQDTFGFFKLDPTVYIIRAMPVKIAWLDFVFVGVGAMVLVVLAAYFPSRKAAKVSPADALRWE